VELYYFDIYLQGVPVKETRDGAGQHQDYRSRADAIPLSDLASRGLRILHGAFTQFRAEFGTQPYALALPQGLEVQRVFSAHRDALDTLADTTEQHPFMRDYAIYGRIRCAPITEQTSWVEYRRYRIPNRNATAVRGHESENLARRSSRIEQSVKLPHFVILSKSTGQSARIFVQQQVWSGDIPQALTPDSWGLSRLSARFAVPAL
jgi:hypothetical protein